MDWDDLKLLIAVAESGNIDVTARNLEVAPHVVAGRINALEKALNCELATRAAGTVTITPAGQRVVELAREFSTKLATLATELGGERGKLSGKVCVTSTAGVINHATKLLEALGDEYPTLQISTLLSSHVVDLRRREADIAIRMFRDARPEYTLRKLGSFGWSLYASERYLAAHPPGSTLVEGHTFIAYDGNFSNTAAGRWIAANVPAESIGVHVGGIRQALDAAARHQGVCVVPCYQAKEPEVVRVTKEVVTTNDAFAVCLASRAEEPGLRVVIDAFAAMFERDQALFAG